jgi:hypothetical protein
LFQPVRLSPFARGDAAPATITHQEGLSHDVWSSCADGRRNIDALLATAPGDAGLQIRALIVKWGALHGVRTVLGALAVVAFLWAGAPR